MEQKHIDEIDESFLGEEFLDEDDVTIERVKAEPKKKAGAKKEKIAPKKASKIVADEEVKVTIIHDDNEPLETSLPPEPKVKAEEKMSFKKDDFKKEEHKATAQVSDPWEEEADEGFFKDASTWKALTGIAVVLLLLSIFTQGFQFSEGAVSAELTQAEAEAKVLQYVNGNLLRPPFLAEVEQSQEQESLYKVTLSVAGESVDSYLTKDGKLFFPQGFEVDVPLGGTEAVVEGAELEEAPVDTVDGSADSVQADSDQEELAAEETDVDPAEEAEQTEGTVEGDADQNEEVAEEEVVFEEPVQETAPSADAPEEQANSADAVQLSVQAKKWLFTPQQLTVTRGTAVQLTIVPSSLDFTFAIPRLGVEQAVKGSTTVTFTPEESGTYEFTCSSCEEWRGMTGTLVVE